MKVKQMDSFPAPDFRAADIVVEQLNHRATFRDRCRFRRRSYGSGIGTTSRATVQVIRPASVVPFRACRFRRGRFVRRWPGPRARGGLLRAGAASGRRDRGVAERHPAGGQAASAPIVLLLWFPAASRPFIATEAVGIGAASATALPCKRRPTRANLRESLSETGYVTASICFLPPYQLRSATQAVGNPCREDSIGPG